MHRILRPQTWPFLAQLGVFTLATAAGSGLVMRLVGCHTSGTAAPPVVLAALVGTAGLAGYFFWSLLQQSQRVATMVKHITVSEPSSTASGLQGPRGQMAGGLRQGLEQTLALIQCQAAAIAEGTSTLDELTASIQQAAESATSSVTVAKQVMSNVQQSTMAMDNTIHGVRYMGTQGLEVAKRLQHLEEHAHEVDKIGQLIGELADRTSVLAFNVSVQATKAGAVGHDCVAAAAEVEHLSGRTTEATRRAAHLAHTMQREIQEMSSALEESTRQMGQWVQAAAQAGQSFKEPEGAVSHLVELVHPLALETTLQARDVATLAKALAELSAVTHQALVGTQHVVATLDELLTVAKH
jgi:methyl-accepting chemotaxis protein